MKEVFGNNAIVMKTLLNRTIIGLVAFYTSKGVAECTIVKKY